MCEEKKNPVASKIFTKIAWISQHCVTYTWTNYIPVSHVYIWINTIYLILWGKCSQFVNEWMLLNMILLSIICLPIINHLSSTHYLSVMYQSCIYHLPFFYHLAINYLSISIYIPIYRLVTPCPSERPCLNKNKRTPEEGHSMLSSGIAYTHAHTHDHTHTCRQTYTWVCAHGEYSCAQSTLTHCFLGEWHTQPKLIRKHQIENKTWDTRDTSPVATATAENLADEWRPSSTP